MAQQPRKLGEMLLKAGIIDKFQLNSALSHQRNLGGRLGASLVQLGYISEKKLLNFLAEQLNCPCLELEALNVPQEVLDFIPAAKARQYNVLPIQRKEIGGYPNLLIATNDPTNLDVLDSLQFMTGYRIRPGIAGNASIQQAINRLYGPAPEERLPDLEPIDKSTFDLQKLKNSKKSTEERLKGLMAKLNEIGVLTKQELEELQ